MSFAVAVSGGGRLFQTRLFFGLVCALVYGLLVDWCLAICMVPGQHNISELERFFFDAVAKASPVVPCGPGLSLAAKASPVVPCGPGLSLAGGLWG